MIRYYIETENDLTPKLLSHIHNDPREHPGKLLDITEQVKRFAEPTEETDHFYILATDWGKPISGTVTNVQPTSGKFFDITEAYLTQTIFDETLIDEDRLYCLVVVGNSNASGMSGQDAPASFVNVAVAGSKKVEWLPDGSAMQVVDNIHNNSGEEDYMTLGRDRLGEYKRPGSIGLGYYNPSVLLGNELASLVGYYSQKTIQFISVSGGTNGSVLKNSNGTTYPALGDNSLYFQYLQQGIQKASDYAVSIGKTLHVPFVVLINGEWESIQYTALQMSQAKYLQFMNEYISELQSMIFGITGQSGTLKVFRHEQHLQLGTDANNMNMKVIQNSVTTGNRPISQVMYSHSILQGSEHLDTLSLFQFYGGMLKYIFNIVYLAKPYVFFSVVDTAVVGNTITLTVGVPVGKLIIDTTKGLETNHGFSLYNGSNVEQTINSVSVSNNKITIVAAVNPSGMRLDYKLKRPYLVQPNPLARAASHIADQENSNFYGLYTPNFLRSFEMILP